MRRAPRATTLRARRGRARARRKRRAAVRERHASGFRGRAWLVYRSRPMAPAFLILHGLSGSGPGHWQPWLAERLRADGHEVHFPDLPEPDTPDPEAWGRELLSALEGVEGDERVVICHSLSCIAWLAACGQIERPVDRVALVAPPSAASGLTEIVPFFPVSATAQDVAQAARQTRL